MAGETETPNIGLQIPGFNQGNWQVPTNYNWNLLDQIFGGEVQVPALNVVDLTVVNFALPNLASIFANSYTVELLGQTSPTTFTFSKIPGLVMLVFYNSGFIFPGSPGTGDYTVSGSVLTTNFALSSGDKLYAAYLHS
jgi:hypothetical protein